MKWYAMILLLSLPCVGLSSDPTQWPPELIEYYKILNHEQREVEVKLPEYKMYIRRGGQSYALLNDKFLKKGDYFNSLEVVSVNSNQVTFKNSSGVDKVVKISSAHKNMVKQSDKQAEDEKKDKEGK